MSGLVGVVTPHAGRWWFGEVITGLDAVLRPAGFDMVLHPVPDDEARAAFFASLPSRERLDALVVVALPLTPAETAVVTATGMPVGCVGVLVPGLPGVAIDEQGCARMVVEHLLDLGHTRIALVSGDPREPLHFTAAAQRRRGYRYALHARGSWPDPALDVPGAWTARGGALAARRLLTVPDPPTAVFAMSDEMAIGVLHVLRSEGLRVPEDVSVAGFDDHPDAATYGLTTLAQPVHEYAARLAAQVVAQIPSARPLTGEGLRPRDGQPGGAQHGAGQPGASQTGSTQPGAAPPGAAQHSTAQHTVAQHTRLVLRATTAPSLAPP